MVTPDLGAAARVQRATAQASTTWLGSWDFDTGPSCTADGWTTLDFFEQLGDFWHVDDFNGLGGGTYGLLVPLEGGQSMWCGARPDASSTVLCGYATLPGYGNDWAQHLSSDCFTVSGDAVVNYLISWDSEPGYDGTTVQYDLCDDNWTDIESSWNAGNGGIYDGDSAAIFDTVVVDTSLHSGSVRVRFYFTADGAWSDQDGMWNTDGGVIVDSLSVTDDTGVISYEDFESASVGDHGAGHWNSGTETGYGDYAALYPGLQVLQEDPCQYELDCIWTFYTGSTFNYGCGGHPGVTAVPFTNTRGQWIKNFIVSPVMPWIGSGTTVQASWWVYRDLPVDNLVFYKWRVRSWFGDCPGKWRLDYSNWYGDNKDWLNTVKDIGDFLEPGLTGFQLAIGLEDMCWLWCGAGGTGACHSHAPLFDEVSVYRIANFGPQWRVADTRLYNDNFATDGTITGTVRVDIPWDIKLESNPVVMTGDSATAIVNDPENGLATDAYTGLGAAVYGFVRVDPPQPAKSWTALSDDPFRWPVVDSLTTTDGNTWYMVRFDTSFTNAEPPIPVADQFCLDLNDNLLTPGDTLWFFFGAKSADAGGSWSYYFNQLNHLDNHTSVTSIKTTNEIEEAAVNAEEMTCLPAAGQEPGSDILYVDDFSGRSGQPYFDTAFQQLGILGKVDRFDVRRPDSNRGRGLGTHVKDVYQQLIPVYKKIIWHSGDLDIGLIGDGTPTTNKSDDFSVLFAFIDQSNRGPGLWITGDDNATEWLSVTSAVAVQLRTAYMNFGVQTDDHISYGLPVSPLVIGAPGGKFDNVTGPDTMVAYGGCPIINNFDVLEQQGTSVAQAYYEGNPSYPAILSQQTTNAQGTTASVILSGYSYHFIRDDRPVGVLDRSVHLKKVLEFLGNTPDDPVAVDPTFYRNSLSQNRPNPFNPTTTIEFSLKERANVQLKIYNVAGQLVRTLVNEARTPGEVHTATWDGRNDAGQSVSSGVYFYKLVAGSFVQTKKMVLLK
jgi:hypothetical protein